MIRRLFICIVSIVFFQACTQTLQSPTKQSVAELLTKEPTNELCPPFAQKKAMLLLGNEQKITRGWSHVIKPEKAQDFVGLKRPLKEYTIDSDRHRTDESCGSSSTFQTILVKKLHVWNNNHSNGIETDITGIPVSRWGSLQVTLRLDSAKSHIPTIEQIQTAFPQIAAPEISKQLDKGEANLYLVFRNGEQEAGIMLSFDPRTDFDRWITLSIPVNKLKFSRKINYVHHPHDYKDTLAQTYQTLSLKAETSSLKTVQHLLDGKPPENQVFKEVAINLHSIYLIPK